MNKSETNTGNTENTVFSCQVKIPPDHFLKEAKQEYSEVLPKRLLIEFLQNSCDAGAENIHFIYCEDENSLEVIDDGDGMDLETLKAGLLTLGGTIKEQNSCGGFGAAKKLLIFSHNKYEIKTGRNNSEPGIFVRGEVVSYNVDECEPIKGTSIKIWFNDNFYKSNAYINTIEWHLRYIVKHSNIKPNIYFYNDKESYNFLESIEFELEYLGKQSKSPKINKCPDSPVEYKYGTGEVRSGGESCRAIVRFNGLYMFEQHISCEMPYYYDCIGSSKEAMNQNRGGFKYSTPYEKDFNSFYLTLANNNVSGMSAAINYTAAKKETPLIISGITYLGEVPLDINPGKMPKRHKMIFGICAAVYSIIEGQMLKTENFGFWYNPNQRGLYAECKMWINPSYFEGEWNMATVYELVEVFIHEYVHYKGHGHDEGFICLFGQKMREFLCADIGFTNLKKMGNNMADLFLSK